jgi:uncharacterized protein YaaR (DUF327 family)
MTNKQNSKLLTSKDEIKEYLGNISNYLFKKYIEKGMPARFEDNRWLAHIENIDEFLKAYTRVSMRKKIDQIPEK